MAQLCLCILLVSDYEHLRHEHKYLKGHCPAGKQQNSLGGGAVNITNYPLLDWLGSGVKAFSSSFISILPSDSFLISEKYWELNWYKVLWKVFSWFQLTHLRLWAALKGKNRVLSLKSGPVFSSLSLISPHFWTFSFRPRKADTNSEATNST